MTTDAAPGTLAVIGAGVVGLMVAWRAAALGWTTTVYRDPDTDPASAVAGGMLGCLAEARPGEDQLLAFSRAAAQRWPQVIVDLGDPSVMVATDTLLVAADSADAGYLTGVETYLNTQGCGLKPLSSREIRSIAPGLGSSVRRGRLAVGEGAVDNRALLRALTVAVAAAGVQTRTGRVTDIRRLPVDQVVVAAGAATPEMLPHNRVRADKGEILRLRRPKTAPAPLPLVVRARWRSRLVYIVPRPDAVVVGATQYEVGDRRNIGPRAGGVADLLRDAIDLLPALAEYQVAEVGGGVRPVTPDALPLIGRIDHRTIIAAGHGRNGIMLSPITAEIVGDLLSGRPDNRWASVLDPRRFT
ncbi:glycine oxidase ThiO [Williamsia sp. CHRR-6]|uniref:glycine oxidase ThiO n=1 Tax=Williamsia sp. CHRR-6 TaxID=2835871 RepID=UPI001BD9ED3C|nr:glycine oxidase ThiO [Williamsia sp. CHRR-6]MBT0567045.1 glycine oxidase ThiO [Williamsia sp. CHRR-6]